MSCYSGRRVTVGIACYAKTVQVGGLAVSRAASEIRKYYKEKGTLYQAMRILELHKTVKFGSVVIMSSVRLANCSCC
jgi:hypothetical protein